jgi:hypothetical protein
MQVLEKHKLVNKGLELKRLYAMMKVGIGGVCLLSDSKEVANQSGSKLPLVSGVFSIICAALVLLGGVVTINGALITYGGYGYGFIEGTNVFFWIGGVFEIIAFAVGLTGAIFQIRRQYFLGTIFSNILLVASAIMLVGETFFKIGKMEFTFAALLLLAVPVVIMAILSIVFIAMAKKEFKN